VSLFLTVDRALHLVRDAILGYVGFALIESHLADFGLVWRVQAFHKMITGQSRYAPLNLVKHRPLIVQFAPSW
jgi:hypothetical protein